VIELAEDGYAVDSDEQIPQDNQRDDQSSAPETNDEPSTNTDTGGVISEILGSINTPRLKYLLVYAFLSVSWFGVAISPFLGDITAIGWMGLLLLFRPLSLYLFSLLTVYLVIPFGLVGVGIPDSGMSITIAVVGMIIASLMTDSPIRRGLVEINFRIRKDIKNKGLSLYQNPE
jgi:hypothetical protein